MSEINLLTKQETSFFKKQKTLKFLRLSSYASLGLVVFLSLLFFFLRIASPLPPLLKEEKSLTDKISQSSERVVRIVVTSQKIHTLSSIISTRPDFTRQLDLLTSNIFSGVTLQSVTFSEKQLTFSVQASSLLPLDNLFNQLSDMVTQKKFQNVTLNGVSISGSDYSSSIVIDY